MVGMMLENCEIKKTKLLEHVRPELSPALLLRSWLWQMLLPSYKSARGGVSHLKLVRLRCCRHRSLGCGRRSLSSVAWDSVSKSVVWMCGSPWWSTV